MLGVLGRIPGRRSPHLRANLVVLALGLFLLPGCAAKHFGRLPDSSEFDKPVETLWQEYPELADCQPSAGRILICAIWDMPYAQDLIDKWGEPDARTWSWWNVMPFCWVPPFHPMSNWEWRKSDKRITATIDHPLGYGYEPHVWLLSIDTVPKPGE